MTHADLVARAVRWLKNSRRCCLVLKEPQGWAYSEWPDAIGWHYRGTSTLIECKTSTSDFYRDHHKVRLGGGMGDLRYYMTEPGLLVPRMLPESWGLLECRARTIRVVKEAVRREGPHHKRPECLVLLQQARTDIPRQSAKKEAL